MRKGGVFFGALSISAIISAICIFSLCCQALAEEISITTYYPSPYGSYEELRSNKMVIGEVDASVIDNTPKGGLTLAPQSQGVIGDLTGVPEGTLMYGTLTDDVEEKSALHYWDGSEWKEMTVKKEDIFVGKVDMLDMGDSNLINTSGTWKRLDISSKTYFTDPKTGEQYVDIEDNNRTIMRVYSGAPTIMGSGFHRVTWGGNLMVDASGNLSKLTIRLRSQSKASAGSDYSAAPTVDELSISEPCVDGSEVCSARPIDGTFYTETVKKENIVAVKKEIYRRYWLEVRTQGGNSKNIVGKTLDFYIQVEKAGL